MQWKKVAPGIALTLAACGPSDEMDRAAVQAVLHGLYDRPGVSLDAGPVAVEGNIAVADWTQGRMGGRALLRRDKSGWHLTLCSGDALRNKDGLMAVGIPAAEAETLARKIQTAEAGVKPERLARMASFQGVMRMDGPN
jgi:hypothetical protein